MHLFEEALDAVIDEEADRHADWSLYPVHAHPLMTGPWQANPLSTFQLSALDVR